MSEAFDVCEAAWIAIGRRHGLTDMHTPAMQAGDFPPSERVTVLVWAALGFIENGGFESLFASGLPGDESFAHTLQALDEIGCQVATEQFREALALFQEARQLPEGAARKAAFNAIPKVARDDAFRRFMALRPTIEACLADFVRKAGLAV